MDHPGRDRNPIAGPVPDSGAPALMPEDAGGRCAAGFINMGANSLFLLITISCIPLNKETRQPAPPMSGTRRNGLALERPARGKIYPCRAAAHGLVAGQQDSSNG